MELTYYPETAMMTLRTDEREVTITNVRTEQEAVAFARECGFTGERPTETVRKP